MDETCRSSICRNKPTVYVMFEFGHAFNRATSTSCRVYFLCELCSERYKGLEGFKLISKEEFIVADVMTDVMDYLDG
jgi:hypothetical protein